MGSGSSTENQQKKKEDELKQIEFQKKFSVVKQDTLTLDTLLELFTNGDAVEMLTVVKSINNGLLQFVNGDKFKGAMRDSSYGFVGRVYGKSLDWFGKEVVEKYTAIVGYQRAAFYVDGVKPLVLAYFFTFHNLSHILKGAGDREPNKGLLWLEVVKEMLKNPNFSVDLDSDSIMGMSMLKLLTYPVINASVALQAFSIASGSYTDYRRGEHRPFVFDKEVFQQLLNGYKMESRADIMLDLIKDQNYEVLDTILEVSDCKELLGKKNFLYDVESCRADSKFVTLLLKHGQSVNMLDTAYNMYCYEYALAMKNFANFLCYKNLPDTSIIVAIVAKFLTKKDYLENKGIIDSIVQKYVGCKNKDEFKDVLDVLTKAGLFELANKLVEWCS